MTGGPQPMARADRLQLAYDIAQQIHQHYLDDVLAIGVFGSVARGSDGPFSDIELHCVLNGREFETAHEWSAGPWKAEVDVYSEDVVLRRASEVDGDWPLTHGAYTHVLAVYDPSDFFPRLRVAALSNLDETFRRVIQDVIVGEIYERLGKIRNALAGQSASGVPLWAVELAKFGACLIGLANRHLYTSSARMFEESLSLPNQPAGYDVLCQMVMGGHLADASHVAAVSDRFWAGVERWAQERDIQIEEQLATLLEREPSRHRPVTKRERAVSYVRKNGDQLDRLRLRRALGELVLPVEAEMVLAPYQAADGSFAFQPSGEADKQTGSLAATIHCMRWLREFLLTGGSQMACVLEYLALIQDRDGSFFETGAGMAQSHRKRAEDAGLTDRFFFTAALLMRLFSLGYPAHPMIQPALRWLRGHWSDWKLITGSKYSLWALLCISRAPIGFSDAQYRRCHATALEWFPELSPRQLTWLLDALQGAGFPRDEPLLIEGLTRLVSLQGKDGAWPDPQAPVETTITALRLLRIYDRVSL